MTVIGIPKALLHYKYDAFWVVYFQQLGVELKFSGKTTKKILSQGLKRSFDEVCLPIKVFYGHVEELRSDVDYLFIPRIASSEPGKYNCPKFLGLSYVAQHSFETLPPLIDVDIDHNEGKVKRNIKKVGKQLGKSSSTISTAYAAATKAQEQYNHYLHHMNYFPNQALKFIETGTAPSGPRPGPKDGQLRIGLVGHPYNLFDEYVNLGLLKKLKEYGVWVTTSMNVPTETADEHAQSSIPFLWEFTGDIMGSAFYFAEHGDVDGIIFVTSFGCGPDSMFIETVQNRMNQYGRPFMILTIDEHSAEAGMLTRIEAFVDMIRRR